jgi:adenosine deaminase
VKRIDHGVRCVEDEELMVKLKELHMPMTVCPISNVKIGPYPDILHHPIKKMMEAGYIFFFGFKLNFQIICVGEF